MEYYYQPQMKSDNFVSHQILLALEEPLKQVGYVVLNRDRLDPMELYHNVYEITLLLRINGLKLTLFVRSSLLGPHHNSKYYFDLEAPKYYFDLEAPTSIDDLVSRARTIAENFGRMDAFT